MVNEYWLQKKTIGGWSHVTWYDDLEQAQLNFNRVSAGDSGYSWRLVNVTTIQEKMLADVVNVEAPNVKLEAARSNVWAGTKPPENKKSGWGATPATVWGSNLTSNNPKPAVTPSGWGTPPAKTEHGLSGSVWLAHAGLRQKKRVPADQVNDMIAQGWYKAGPRTTFP